MEPYRPFVDNLILDILSEIKDEKLDRTVKQKILEKICNEKLNYLNKKITLFTACRLTVQSYKKSLLNKNLNQILLPYWRGGKFYVDYCRF